MGSAGPSVSGSGGVAAAVISWAGVLGGSARVGPPKMRERARRLVLSRSLADAGAKNAPFHGNDSISLERLTTRAGGKCRPAGIAGKPSKRGWHAIESGSGHRAQGRLRCSRTMHLGVFGAQRDFANTPQARITRPRTPRPTGSAAAPRRSVSSARRHRTRHTACRPWCRSRPRLARAYRWPCPRAAHCASPRADR